MPRKARQPRAVREGPETNYRNFEAQQELLGKPIEYLRTLMLPEQCEPMRVPDEVSAMSAIFKAPQIVENIPFTGKWDAVSGTTLVRAPDDPGESTVYLFPSTHGGIWYTGGTDQLANDPLNPRDLFIRPTLAGARTVVTVSGTGKYIAHAWRNDYAACVPRRRQDGIPIFEVDMPFDPTTEVLRVTLSSPSLAHSSLQVSLRIAARFGGAWNTTDWDVPINGGSGFVDFRGSGVSLLDITGLWFRVDDGPTSISDWRISLGPAFDTVDPPPILTFPGRSACTMLVRNFDQLTSMALTTNERPAALSGLVTWMGSTLENGGNIAAARLPMGSTTVEAPNGDIYGFLSQMPVYASDFPLKDGAYVWWAPDSEQEYFFLPYGEIRADSLTFVASLAFAMRRDEPSQTVRLRADANFETQTRSVLYSSAVSSTNPSFPRALEIAKAFPAVTINEDHVSTLGSAWSRAKAWMSKPSNWLSLLGRGVRALGFIK